MCGTCGNFFLIFYYFLYFFYQHCMCSMCVFACQWICHSLCLWHDMTGSDDLGRTPEELSADFPYLQFSHLPTVWWYVYSCSVFCCLSFWIFYHFFPSSVTSHCSLFSLCYLSPLPPFLPSSVFSPPFLSILIHMPFAKKQVHTCELCWIGSRCASLSLSWGGWERREETRQGERRMK